MRTFVTATAILVASVSLASAQSIDDECQRAAVNAGVATTHNVVFDAENQVCVATLLGRPMFGTPGYVAGAAAAPALGGLGVTGTGLAIGAGVLGTVAIVAATGGT